MIVSRDPRQHPDNAHGRETDDVTRSGDGGEAGTTTRAPIDTREGRRRRPSCCIRARCEEHEVEAAPARARRHARAREIRSQGGGIDAEVNECEEAWASSGAPSSFSDSRQSSDSRGVYDRNWAEGDGRIFNLI